LLTSNLKRRKISKIRKTPRARSQTIVDQGDEHTKEKQKAYVEEDRTGSRFT